MKETELKDVVTVGSHVVVQRLDFKKVYRVSENGSLALGKEEIKMSEIIGKPFGTTYNVISSQEKRDKKSKRNPTSTLVMVERNESLEDLKNSVTSGYDNRSINDDGKSQKLSKDDILGLRDAGKSGREIVSSLIENNVSFTEKTEYSQEKYIRKKEKKYCQFLTIHKPTFSALQEIYLRQDSAKMYGLRMDTLAQIFSYSDIKCDGTFILYDSGTLGLVPAGVMSRIGANTSGNLVYLHSGDHLPQMPIVRAMNFSQEQFDRLSIASIFDFLKLYYKENKSENIVQSIKVEGEKINTDDNCGSVKIKEELNVEDNSQSVKKEELNVEDNSQSVKKEEISIEDNCDSANIKIEKLDTEEKNSINIEVGNNKNSLDSDKNVSEKNKCDVVNSNDLKRKNTENVQEGPVLKKSKKTLDIERCVELISESKADSLIVIAKEHPFNIINTLLSFVKSSRPFVIYHLHREPLQETYVSLKKQNNVINLKLFSNFLRSYQVLPDRTHPDILTNDCGGYLLTGYTTD